MSRREEYEKRAEELLAPIVELNGFELVDVEYVKEAGNWYLRGYIDKPGGITVNDCETVSRAFSDKLDENDFIEDSYIMEISSPGLDRPLKKDKDFERNMGKLVEIRTYRPIEKQKEFCGILTAYDSNSVTIDEDGTERVFDKKDTALIRLVLKDCKILRGYHPGVLRCFSKRFIVFDHFTANAQPLLILGKLFIVLYQFLLPCFDSKISLCKGDDLLGRIAVHGYQITSVAGKLVTSQFSVCS